MFSVCLKTLFTAHCSNNILDTELLNVFFMMCINVLPKIFKNVI